MLIFYPRPEGRGNCPLPTTFAPTMSLRIIRYLSLASCALLAISVFLPWVTIRSLDLTLTGMNTVGTDFGKPGFFHLLMVAFYLLFTAIPKIWAKRFNLLVGALNLAWALRNFLMIPACSGGECPDREAGIWLALAGSILLLIGALFPDVDLEKLRRRN